MNSRCDFFPPGTSAFSSKNIPPIAHLVVIFSAALNVRETGGAWETSNKIVASSEIGDH
jgi:hypothetical protein